jgi:hypothetical protein
MFTIIRFRLSGIKVKNKLRELSRVGSIKQFFFIIYFHYRVKFFFYSMQYICNSVDILSCFLLAGKFSIKYPLPVITSGGKKTYQTSSPIAYLVKSNS